MKYIVKNIHYLALLVIGFGVYFYFFVERPDASWPITNYPPTSGTTWVAFGDSLTYGAQVPRDATYPNRLAEHYSVSIINSGINGNTTVDGLQRLEDDVLAYDPKVVFVGLGGNDMLRKQDPVQMGRNLKRIVTRIQSTGAVVVLLGLNGSIIYGSEWRDQWQEVAKETGSIFIDDTLDGIIGNRKYLLEDNIHPNSLGYEKITERIIQEANPWLSELN